MSRTDVSGDAFRASLAAQQEWRAYAAERLIQRWAFFLLMATTLYAFIGPSPFVHAVQIDADTGETQLSPINRYVWLLLGGMAMPLLWLRRDQLRTTLLRLWPLLLLMFWFAMTTRWAIDPGASNRRFFAYMIAMLISLSVAIGFGSARKLHRAFAVTCAVMIGIDAVSTVALPGKSMTSDGLAAIHSHKNVMGAVLLFCGMMVAPYILSQRRWAGRLFWIVVLAVCFVLLVLTRSKTSLAILSLVLLSMPLVLLILRVRGGVFVAAGAMILISLLAALMLWLAWCGLEGRDPLGPVRGFTFTQRTDIWAFVFAEIFKRPIRGVGFGSFWDIDASLQPSLQGDEWFASKALANEAHNGYLDLFVTTGVVGLIGSLFVLFRWIFRGLTLLRRAVRGRTWEEQALIPAFTALGIFPLIIGAHNFMESSLFMANALFGLMVLIIGISLELDFARDPSDLAADAYE